MTAEQTHRILRTFSIVERQSQIAALIFYQRLFQLDPGLRPLFHTDIELQTQKLMDMLSAAMSLMERPDQFTDLLEDLGARHLAYGVKTSHYETVGHALLDMLEQVLGAEFDAEARAAWVVFYQKIAEAMLRGATAVVR